MNAPRPDRPEWLAANEFGMEGERAVADLLRGIGLAVAKMADKCADLEIGGRIEVKFDRQAHKTGRVAVEVEYRGRPSGVNTTCAGCWAFKLTTGEIVLIAVSRLRAAVANLPNRPAGESATIRLLPLADLRRLGLSVGGAR